MTAPKNFLNKEQQNLNKEQQNLNKKRQHQKFVKVLPQLDGPFISCTYSESKSDLFSEGEVIVFNGISGKYEKLPSEWLKKYNCVDDDEKELWFNKEGFLHRLDGPAVEQTNGDKEWWVNGKRHRHDGPAVEWVDEVKIWYFYGKCHRLGGPAVEHVDGHKEWWVNGKLHRKDGPSIEWSGGGAEWWVNGKRHRLNGPAVTFDNLDEEWWVNGLNMEKHADNPNIPEMMGKYFYFLCVNKNLHIRKKALANPNCPLVLRVANKIMVS